MDTCSCSHARSITVRIYTKCFLTEKCHFHEKQLHYVVSFSFKCNSRHTQSSVVNVNIRQNCIQHVLWRQKNNLLISFQLVNYICIIKKNKNLSMQYIKVQTHSLQSLEYQKNNKLKFKSRVVFVSSIWRDSSDYKTQPSVIWKKWNQQNECFIMNI